MKNYFQKIYNETGVKPFTFLNCALTILLPIVILIVAIASNDYQLFTTLPIIGLIVCWVIDIALLFYKFKDGKRTAILFFLGLLASIAFFCKLILFPLIKFLINMMGSATAVQTGDFAGASNNANRATAEAGGVKMSAFNWFVYDDRKFEDIAPSEPAESYITNSQAWNSELGRNFTSDEDLNAQQMGYSDAKNAYDSGVKVEDITKKY